MQGDTARDDIGPRVVDTSASAHAKLAAPKNASLSTEVSNLSARATHKIKDLRRNAELAGSKIFGVLRASKRPEAGNEDDPSPDAFNAANREYEPQLFSEIREAWVRRHMAMRAADYMTQEDVPIKVLTWNVAAKRPPPAAQLSELLRDVISDGALLVIGLQEAVELTASNVGAGAAGPIAGNAVAWESAITKEVCGEGGAKDAHVFEQVVCRQMMGIVLLVYVRAALRSACSPPRTCSVGTGLLGLMGNKGAVAASLSVHASSICIVCSHLASGSSAVDARNVEYAQLVQRIAFSESAGGAAEAVAPDTTEPSSVLDHEFVVWLGDLNYRINLDAEATRTLAMRGDYESLRAHDQLLAAQRSGAAFDSFSEARLEFAPTYKYDIGADAFDTSEKKRPPAWCDRVLWRVATPAPSADVADTSAAAVVETAPRLLCNAYRRHDDRTSDHRPVSAALVLSVARSDETERARVFAEISRSLDKWENSCTPTAELDATECDLGPLLYGEPARGSITITNSGQTALKFSFEPLPLPDDAGLGAALPPWLEVSPMSNLLMPGEACRVRLTARVAKPHAAALTEAALRDGGAAAVRRMEAILLLHLLHGRDYYVTVGASWRASIMGLRLTSRLTVGSALHASSRGGVQPGRHSTDGAPVDLAPYELRAMIAVVDTAVDSAQAAAARALRASDEVQQAAFIGEAAAPDVDAAATDASVTSGGMLTSVSAATMSENGVQASEAAAREAVSAARDANALADALFAAFPDEAFAGSAFSASASLLSSEASARSAALSVEALPLLAALETGDALPGVSLPAVGFTLLRWCAAVAEAVVPAPLLAAAEAAAPSKSDSLAIVGRLPPEHAAVFVSLLLCLRRLLRAHRAATEAATQATKAAGHFTAREPEAAWGRAIAPLPGEYLPPPTNAQAPVGNADDVPAEDAEKSGEKAVPRVALSSRLCTLVGAAFLVRGGWWSAVFVRHFLSDLELADEALEWVAKGKAAGDASVRTVSLS